MSAYDYTAFSFSEEDWERIRAYDTSDLGLGVFTRNLTTTTTTTVPLEDTFRPEDSAMYFLSRPFATQSVEFDRCLFAMFFLLIFLLHISMIAVGVFLYYNNEKLNPKLKLVYVITMPYSYIVNCFPNNIFPNLRPDPKPVDYPDLSSNPSMLKFFVLHHRIRPKHESWDEWHADPASKFACRSALKKLMLSKSLAKTREYAL
ncbi:unnamed protein product [Bursaphelenchus okinawaensis]|uniref:Uncharacterized protein n=1 Tax=Bursaphelenchus okinawaensis TaxID=465554 RepID=A0A811LIX1_9BILA|nr:unnamed protein product [Bursaphelenchus okinawaensis]CAG9124494.1 unnamed protein product [Bursaphelenchus okinawaensis]